MLLRHIDLKEEKRRADEQFKSFLANGYTEEQLLEIVQKIYFTVMYLSAYRCRSFYYPQHERHDRVSDLVLNSFTALEKKIREGKFDFRGNSRFSTWLFAIVKNKYRDEIKVYFPAPIRRKGTLARDIYFRYVVKDMPLEKIREGLEGYCSCEEFHSIIRLCHPYYLRYPRSTLSLDYLQVQGVLVS